MFATTRKILSFLDRRSKVQIGLLFVPMALVSALEMLSIGLVVPLIQVLMAGPDGPAAGGVGDLVAKMLRTVLPESSGTQALSLVAGAFAAVFVVKNALLFAMVFTINSVIRFKMATFVQRLFALYLHRPMGFHFHRNSAEIIRNLTNTAGRAFEGIRLDMLIIFETLMVVATFALLLVVDPAITLIAMSVLVLFALAYYRVTSPMMRRWGARLQDLGKAQIQTVAESLAGLRDIKVLQCHGYMQDLVTDQTNELARFHSRLPTMQHLPRVSLEVLVVVGFVLVVVGLISTGVGSERVIATLGLFGMAAMRLMPSMNRILSSAAELRQRSANVETLHEDLRSGLADSESELLQARRADLPFTREIRLHGIAFHYGGSGASALNDVDLTIRRGESIGVVGPSGAGKSTLIDILFGLLTPEEGRFEVDGLDAVALRGAWQKNIGFVPQQVHLLDDTLRRNIAFGVRDGDIDAGRIDAVVRLARLEDLVASLPQGLDTVIGERGARLSGGQRQRVAIARALYRNPDVLIFDEATSALDNETEREITAAVDGLAGDKTLIIIAHRLSTVRNCDRIAFLRAGSVVATGTFDELMSDTPEFRRLATLGDTASDPVTLTDDGPKKKTAP